MDGLAALDEPSTVLNRARFDVRTTSRATSVSRGVLGGFKESDHMWIIFRSKTHSRGMVAVALRVLVVSCDGRGSMDPLGCRTYYAGSLL